VTWNPEKLGGLPSVTELAFGAEDPSREPLAGAWVIVPYVLEGVGKDGD
jgi:hypothetical protein